MLMELKITNSGSEIKKIVNDTGTTLFTIKHLVKTKKSKNFKDITSRQDPIFLSRCSETTWLGKLFTNLRIFDY